MRIEFRFFVTTDMLGQFLRHLIHAPSGEWLFQEHLPAAGVYRLAKSERAGLLQTLRQRAPLSVRTQGDEQAQSAHDRYGGASVAKPPVVRPKNQDPNARQK